MVSEGGNNTTVTGTFTAGGWDGDASGTGVSDFGAAFITAPITANWQFSNPVDNLAFTLDHVSSSGTTYDDEFTLAIYDENGNLISRTTDTDIDGDIDSEREWYYSCATTS